MSGSVRSGDVPNGCVVWVTGRPSSGKSTFAERVRPLIAQALGACVLLDGDAVRGRLVPRPGYSEAERDAFYATLAGLAALLAEQGLVVLVPATAHRAEFRDRARELAPRFLEVFVNTPVETCAARDSKGLYAKSDRGEVTQLPGVGESYQAPAQPDVVADGGRDEAAYAELISQLRRP